MFMAGVLLFYAACSSTTISTNEKAKLFELPDGSLVILNKHSAAQCIIDEEQRMVKLDGEAYFDVKKSDVPFEIHTSKGVIKVLGTVLSVSLVDDELGVEVDKGLVEVKTESGSKKLRKGERVIYDDVKKLWKKGKAEFMHHVWTDDFKDELHQLGRGIEKESKRLGNEIRHIGSELKIKL